MSHLPEKATNISLCHIAIPGTHNSGTYSIKESSAISPDMNLDILTSFFSIFFNIKFNKWSVTQRTNLTTQLQSGIRYFDFRVALKREGCKGIQSKSSVETYPCFYIVHGQYANRVNVELEEIKGYLVDHPKEVVVIDFQHFHKFDDTANGVFAEMVKKIPSLAELWSRKKQAIVIGHKKTLPTEEEGVSLIWPRSAISQPWPNTRNPKTLKKYLSKAYESWMNKIGTGNFFVFQGILSPNIEFIITHPFSGVEKLAKKANVEVEKWLDGLESLRGIVITDFSIMGFSNFARSVFSMNW
nr:Phospholipase C [Hymenolepis microstoma]